MRYSSKETRRFMKPTIGQRVSAYLGFHGREITEEELTEIEANLSPRSLAEAVQRVCQKVWEYLSPERLYEEPAQQRMPAQNRGYVPNPPFQIPTPFPDLYSNLQGIIGDIISSRDLENKIFFLRSDEIKTIPKQTIEDKIFLRDLNREKITEENYKIFS